MPACIWRKTMQLNKMKIDASGKISTIMLAIVAIIVVVIVVVAVFIIVTNNGDNQQKGTPEMAPGTTLDFTVTGGEPITELKAEIIGQSKDIYFAKTTYTVSGNDIVLYSTMAKPGGSKYQVTGTEKITTIHDGEKMLDVATDLTDGSTLFVDPSTGLVYKITTINGDSTVTAVLNEYSLIRQNSGSYKQSSAIGTGKSYTLTYDGTPYTVTSTCIADCRNGQYGVEYDLSSLGGSTIDTISNSPLGLPIDAVETNMSGSTSSGATTHIWMYTDGMGDTLYLYYDPVAKVVDNIGTDIEMAPGSMMDYTVTGSQYTEMKLEYIGQNADSDFVKTTYYASSGSSSDYILESKNPDTSGYQLVGTQAMDTVDGQKTLNVVNTTTSGVTTTQYLDQMTGLPYKMILMVSGKTTTFVLKNYALKMQNSGSYTQSDSVGTTYNYALTDPAGTGYTMKVKCVADCTNGQYGFVYDLSSMGIGEMYSLGNNPQGLLVNAQNSGSVKTLETRDGTRSVQIWNDTADGLTFYIDSASKVIYQIDMISGSTTIVFTLKSISQEGGSSTVV